jgi:hypothetical protein
MPIKLGSGKSTGLSPAGAPSQEIPRGAHARITKGVRETLLRGAGRVALEELDARVVRVRPHSDRVAEF